MLGDEAKQARQLGAGLRREEPRPTKKSPGHAAEATKPRRCHHARLLLREEKQGAASSRTPPGAKCTRADRIDRSRVPLWRAHFNRSAEKLTRAAAADAYLWPQFVRDGLTR